MKRFVSLFLIHIFFLSMLNGEESLYLMPRDAESAVSDLAYDLKNAQKSIQVAIYSFTHRELAKSLKKAAKRGVSVTIIFDEESNKPKSYSRIGDLAKIRSIRCFTLKGLPNKNKGYFGKMHMKLAIIDGKKVYFGSANWSNSAFSRNYELLYSSESPKIIKSMEAYFREILHVAKAYD